MPELTYNRSQWQAVSEVSLKDFSKVSVETHHLALQHLANQLLAFTEPALLESVWKANVKELMPKPGKIDWKLFIEIMSRRIE